MGNSVYSCRAIIIKEGKVLLIHRTKNGEEYWVFPGGHTEPGETPEQTISREIMEELSLKLTKITKKVDYVHPDTGNTEACFYCKVEDKPPKLGGEESTKNSSQDWYDLVWVETGFALNIEKLHPSPVAVIFKESHEDPS